MPAHAGPGSVECERDAWVQAIDKLCSEWKRKSMGEHMFVAAQTLRHISIEEEAEEPERTASEANGGLGGDYPPVSADQVSPGPPSAAATGSDPSVHKPVAQPRRKMSAPDDGPEDSPTVSTPVPPIVLRPSPSPSSPHPPFTASHLPSPVPQACPSSPVPQLCPLSPKPSPTSKTWIHQPPSHDSSPAAVPLPPPPPPLFMKWTRGSKKKLTKPFHWDVVAPDKVNSAASLHPPMF